jgi:hypothetical protein
MFKEVDWILPTELDTNKNANEHTKKLWKKHQDNEYTRVNEYKEALCFGCLSNKASNATVSDICGDCAGKKGREALLTVVKVKHYGLCYFCNTYKFGLEQINIRLCFNCHRRVANVTKEYNKKGGILGTDPFWLSLKKKHGKDWKEIMTDDRRFRR